MEYRYAAEKQNYEDYAAGRVLLNQPGATSFPVRLASEIYQRCAAHLVEWGSAAPYRVYDPCCGTGYLLAALGFLHGETLAAVFASDIDADAVSLARRNLAMLSPAGLQARIDQLEQWVEQFGKDSHREAVNSGQRLMSRLAELPHPIPAMCFVADATQPQGEGSMARQVDLLITDVPYGRTAQWGGGGTEGEALSRLLEAQRGTLAEIAIVAIVSEKGQIVQHPAYRRIQRLTLGKRQITLLRPYPNG